MIKRFLGKLRDFWLRPVISRLDIINNNINNINNIIRVYNNYDYNYNKTLRPAPYLDSFGYKVYSQNDEDGIINEIFRRIGTTNKTFVEFGVQDGLESNCHFLLFNGWRGLWIDGNEKNIIKLKEHFSEPVSTKQLTAVNAFITVDNINDLIKENGFEGEIDLLSIDIDGNDYWIWQAIKCIQPRVVVIEYNAKFPPPCEWIMEYDPNHVWDASDKYGASLKSLELLGNKLGYRLVGTNICGINAFFVKNEGSKDLFPEPSTSENLYHRWDFSKHFGFTNDIYHTKYTKGYIGNKYSNKS
jgi:hypothetical protein